MTLKLSRLLWVVVLACAFLALGSGCAEAKTGLASWYGPGFEGSPTASGEPFDPYGYTVAHKTLPLGTDLVVSYGGYSVEVTVNDRGPYVGARDLDLSQGAAEAIGLTQTGVDYVEYHRADDGSYRDSYRGSYRDSYRGGYYSGGETYDAGAQVESGGGVYVVQSGETLSSIAADLGISVEDLAAANGITDADLIYAGQTLYF